MEHLENKFECSVDGFLVISEILDGKSLPEVVGMMY